MSYTVSSWLQAATASLLAAGVATARLDCLVLLEDGLLGTNRALLLAHPETALTDEQLAVLDAQLQRRAGHEPLAYIRGKSEFYGRVFAVDKNVLVPRPESETMIEMLLQLPATAQTRLVDVGTGSGALAITAKLELPAADVIGIDIDPACLAVAQQNAERLGAAVSFAQGDLLEPPRAAATLLCNLPYVPDGYAINRAAGHEPRLALFAGSDGLDLYRRLFRQLGRLGPDDKPDYILAESLPEQHGALAAHAATQGYVLQCSQDFIQQFQRLW